MRDSKKVATNFFLSQGLSFLRPILGVAPGWGDGMQAGARVARGRLPPERQGEDPQPSVEPQPPTGRDENPSGMEQPSV